MTAVNISMMMALAAGLISFLSPCVLPLVPGYVSFISGVSVSDMTEGPLRPALFDKRHLMVLFNALLFVTGFTFVFVTLGASATWLGAKALTHISALTKISGIVIMVFGVIKLGIFKTGWFLKDTRFRLDVTKKGVFFSLGLGMAFAFGWTPCTGPILGAILTYAGTMENLNMGIRLLLVYSAGLGIPFLLTAIFIQTFFSFFNRIKKWMGLIEKATGVILIAMGFLIYTDSLAGIAGWFPFLNRFVL